MNDHGGNYSPQQTKTTNTLIKEGKFKLDMNSRHLYYVRIKSTETLVKEKTEFRSEMNPTKLESKTANKPGKKGHEYNGVYTRLD